MSGKSGLALRRISGHCTVTADKIYAWYLLDPGAGRSRPTASASSPIIDGADVYAQLVKRSACTSASPPALPGQPVGRRHDANAPLPLPGWRDYLLTDQRTSPAAAWPTRRSTSESRSPREGLYKALGGLAGTLSDREVASALQQIRATDEIMASPGMDGAPATPVRLEWLMHRPAPSASRRR